jgi:hypothetical protein
VFSESAFEQCHDALGISELGEGKALGRLEGQDQVFRMAAHTGRRQRMAEGGVFEGGRENCLWRLGCEILEGLARLKSMAKSTARYLSNCF